MSCDDSEWIEARITATETSILLYEAAIDALSSGAQTYSLNTGQTTQSVTKAQLGSLKSTLLSLENRRETLRAKLRGGSSYVRPGF